MFAKILAKLKGYRTMIGAGFFGIVSGVASLPDVLSAAGVQWQSILAAEIKEHALLYTGAMAAFFGFMRWITTTPVGTPEPPAPPAPPAAGQT